MQGAASASSASVAKVWQPGRETFLGFLNGGVDTQPPWPQGDERWSSVSAASDHVLDMYSEINYCMDVSELG